MSKIDPGTGNAPDSRGLFHRAQFGLRAPPLNRNRNLNPNLPFPRVKDDYD
jgi:hypothetical protein